MREIEAFFDAATSTASYLVWDPATHEAAIIDAVLDFEAVVKDPTANPARIQRNLTCDYVHPNAAGYAALGSSIPTSLFN